MRATTLPLRVRTRNKATRTKPSESSQDHFFYTLGRDKGTRASEKERGFAFGAGITSTMMVELPADARLHQADGWFCVMEWEEEQEEDDLCELGGPGHYRGMLASHGEGPDCPCSRASLANWNVWVHGVQEGPPPHHPALDTPRVPAPPSLPRCCLLSIVTRSSQFNVLAKKKKKK